VLVYALAANGSQTGEGYIRGQVQQVPAQSQNRGPGNSTGDVLQKSGKRKMQDPSLRTYRIAFLGSNASGNLPMFTRVQATTGKRAIKAFIERCEPVKGWFLGEPEDITDQLKKEEEEAGSKPQI
jgi:hypothetical protein